MKLWFLRNGEKMLKFQIRPSLSLLHHLLASSLELRRMLMNSLSQGTECFGSYFIILGLGQVHLVAIFCAFTGENNFESCLSLVGFFPFCQRTVAKHFLRT